MRGIKRKKNLFNYVINQILVQKFCQPIAVITVFFFTFFTSPLFRYLTFNTVRLHYFKSKIAAVTAVLLHFFFFFLVTFFNYNKLYLLVYNCIITILSVKKKKESKRLYHF